jgi:hypothetical protein
MGKAWSVMIGHGCQSAEEMQTWTKAQNQEAGMRLYRVMGLPPKPKPQPVPEKPALSLLEQAIAERALGLDRSNGVSQNFFEPTNDTERRTVGRMVDKGWMREGNGFFLTVEGLHLLNDKRQFGFSQIG